MANTVLSWSQYTEAVVGLNHPTLTDVDNRALRQMLNRSGFGPDSVFRGFPLGNSAVNAGSSDYTGTAPVRITAAIADAVAAGLPYCFVPRVASDGTAMLPYNASLVTFNTSVKMLREGGPSSYDWQAYGADPAGVLDATVGIQAALTAGLTNKALVSAAAGTYLTSSGLTANGLLVLRCEGAGVVTIKPSSGLAAGTALSISPGPLTLDLEVSGLTIDLTNAPNATGLNINNIQFSRFRDIEVLQGATGIQCSNFGASQLAGLRLRNQTTAGMTVNGDGSGELYYKDIDIAVSTASVTMPVAFKLTRTTTVDAGGHYFRGVRVTNPGAGTINQGMVFTSSAGSPSIVAAFLHQCVCDAVNGTGDGCLLSNVSDVEIDKPWFNSTAVAGNNVAGLHIDKSANITVDGGRFFSNSRDISITGASSLVYLRAGIFLGTATNIFLDAVGTKSSIDALDCFYNGTVTNDATQLAHLVASTPFKTSGMEVWVRGDDGTAQTLRLVNKAAGATNPNKHIRVSGTGDLQVLNSAGSTVIGTIQEGGGYVSPGPIQGQPMRTAAFLATAVASQALNLSNGNVQEFNITSNIAVVIQAPTNTPGANVADELIVTFYNNSGGALGTQPTFATGSGAFLLSAAAATVASTQGVAYRFVWSPNAAGGARYREVSRTVSF